MLEQRLKIEPEPEAWMELARACAMQHDWKRMAACARKGSDLEATNETVQSMLPGMERLEKELPRLKTLEKEIAAANTSIPPLLERAALFLKAGWPALALPDAEAALSIDEGSRAAVLAKAAALVALKRNDEAEALLVNLANDPVSHADEWPALALLDQQLAANGPSAPVYAQRADRLNGLGQYALAEADAQAALKRDPENALALAAHGIALGEQKRTWPALADLRRATELNPRDTNAWLIAGELESGHHHYAPAVEALTRVLQAEPRNERALRTRADCLHVLGRNAEADADSTLLQSLKTKP